MHYSHMVLIDEYLAQVARYIETSGREGIGRLLIEMPPRHGKSTNVARLFPSWVIGKWPDKRLMIVSYGDDLSTGHSRFIRGLLRTARYQDIFPGVELAQDSRAKNAWNLAGHEGGMEALGKGGALTGKGWHLLVMDDTVKNREEAESQTQRDRDWNIIQDDLMTREEPGGAVVSIMTRWHIDDPHGRFRKNEADKWVTLTLPAIAEENDPLARAPGAPLCPERYSLDWLRDRQAHSTSYSWLSLYQQRPIAREGKLFKQLPEDHILAREPANIVRYVRGYDLAFSSKTSADYTAGVLLGLTDDGTYIVLDVQRYQDDWERLPDRIVYRAMGDSERVRIGIENAFYQSRLVEKLLDRAELHRYSIEGVMVDKDKFTRALPFAARWNAGQVYVLDRAWTQEYIDELLGFDQWPHDDQVDASVSAYTMLEDPREVGVSDNILFPL